MTMEKKYILKVDDFEHRVLVNALNSMRNQLIQEDQIQRRFRQADSEGYQCAC